MLRSRIADRQFQVVTLLSCVVFVATAAAQETPTPPPSSTPGESPFPSISPEQAMVPSPTPEQTPSPSPARGVRISFIPPPMDGTISLGIYDQSGRLIRVLYQNAQLDDFVIGADALVTRWDGKDDSYQDSPAGRYHAHGYLIGQLKLEDLGESSPPPMEPDANIVKLRLVRNPLRKEKKPVLELIIGFNRAGSYLKTSDGLPLFTVSKAPNLTHAWIATKNENAVDAWQDDGTSVHQFRISNVDQMMAFDCGEFELK
jgi:hypothetical protein